VTRQVTVFGETQVPGSGGLWPIVHDGVGPGGSVSILDDRLLYLFALLRTWSLNTWSLSDGIIRRHQKRPDEKNKPQHPSLPCANTMQSLGDSTVAHRTICLRLPWRQCRNVEGGSKPVGRVERAAAAPGPCGQVIAAPELDELILSFCDEHWRKVARVFSKTMQVLEDRGIQVSGSVADALDARMEVLVRTGRLEAKGDIREWRYSEVRLPIAAATRQRLEA